jgi:hypothetical protein
MTDLTSFGVEVEDAPVDEPEPDHQPDEESEEPGSVYSNGRCPAIANGNRRCKNHVSRMMAAEGFCGTHRDTDSLTIHDDPVRLVRHLGNIDGRSARCRALNSDGERCTYDCGPLEYFCGTHQEMDDPETVDELENEELDVDLIRGALHDLVGLPDERLLVSQAGLRLPRRYAESEKQLIIRTPWGTTNSTSGPRDRVYDLITPDDWDVSEERPESARNPECLESEHAPLVGLMLAGEEQRWLPVNLVESDDRDPAPTARTVLRGDGE